MKRAAKEKERLLKLHLITSADKLKTALSEIEEENVSNTKKTQKKLAVIREQMIILAIRYCQRIFNTFTD